jgi:hypothetical protein
VWVEVNRDEKVINNIPKVRIQRERTATFIEIEKDGVVACDSV